MKKVWITYILILLGSICCVQLISVHPLNEVDIEQVPMQNNDAEESETRIGLDDEIIAETLLSPHLLPPPKACFHRLPGSPLPYISLRLHFPPPNLVY